MRRTIGRRQLLAAAGATAVGSATLVGSTAAATRDDGPGTTGTIDWLRAYGRDRSTVAASAVPTGDGYLVVGGQGPESGDRSAWTAKIAEDGRRRRVHRYEDAPGTVEAVLANGDGTYLLAGGAARDDASTGWAATVDASGAVQWWTSYEEPTTIRSAAATEDGYLLVGTLPDPGGLWTGVVGDDGTLRQARTNRRRLGFSVDPVGDGTVIASGVQMTRDGIRSWVGSLAGDGRTRWNQHHETRATVRAALPTADGAVLVGYTMGSDTRDGWFGEVDSFGRLQWHRTYGANDLNVLYSVAETGDGFLLGGWTGTQSERDAWLLAVDESGAPRWDHTLDLTAWDRVTDLVGTDGGVLLVGGSGDSALLGLHDPSAESDPGPTTTATPAGTSTPTADGATPSDGGRTVRAGAAATRATGSRQGSADDPTTTDGSGPGLGVASAVAGVGSAAAALWAGRRSDEN